jgi:hypothetical protein
MLFFNIADMAISTGVGILIFFNKFHRNWCKIIFFKVKDLFHGLNRSFFLSYLFCPGA